MGYLHTAAIILHIVFAAAWFGLAIGLSILSKEAVQAESRGAAVAALRLVKSMTATAVVFYLLACANFALGIAVNGSGVYGWPYHAALALGLALLVVQFVIIRPSVAAMRSNLGTPVGRSARTRLGLGLGLGQAAWFGMVLLMYAQNA